MAAITRPGGDPREETRHNPMQELLDHDNVLKMEDTLTAVEEKGASIAEKLEKSVLPSEEKTAEKHQKPVTLTENKMAEKHQKPVTLTEKNAAGKLDKSVPPSEEKATEKLEKSVPPSEEKTTEKLEKSVPPSEEKAAEKLEKSVPPSEEKATEKLEKSPSEEKATEKLEKSVPPSEEKATEKLEKFVSPSEEKATEKLEKSVPPSEEKAASRLQPPREATSIRSWNVETMGGLGNSRTVSQSSYRSISTSQKLKPSMWSVVRTASRRASTTALPRRQWRMSQRKSVDVNAHQAIRTDHRTSFKRMATTFLSRLSILECTEPELATWESWVSSMNAGKLRVTRIHRRDLEKILNQYFKRKGVISPSSFEGLCHVAGLGVAKEHISELFRIIKPPSAVLGAQYGAMLGEVHESNVKDGGKTGRSVMRFLRHVGPKTTEVSVGKEVPAVESGPSSMQENAKAMKLGHSFDKAHHPQAVLETDSANILDTRCQDESTTQRVEDTVAEIEKMAPEHPDDAPIISVPEVVDTQNAAYPEATLTDFSSVILQKCAFQNGSVPSKRRRIKQVKIFPDKCAPTDTCGRLIIYLNPTHLVADGNLEISGGGLFALHGEDEYGAIERRKVDNLHHVSVKHDAREIPKVITYLSSKSLLAEIVLESGERLGLVLHVMENSKTWQHGVRPQWKLHLVNGLPLSFIAYKYLSETKNHKERFLPDGCQACMPPVNTVLEWMPGELCAEFCI